MRGRYRNRVLSQCRRGTFIALTFAAALAVGACGSAEDPDSTPQPAATSETRDAEATRTPIPAPGLAATVTPGAVTPTPSGASQQGQQAQQPTPTAAAAQSPTPLPDPAPIIGDTVSAQGWDITVTGTDLFPRIGDHRAEGIYLYVLMTLKNTSGSEASFPFEGLLVVDHAGNEHFLAIDATKESLTFDFGVDLTKKYPPGATQNVAAAFDIPTDATGLTLTTPTRVFSIALEYGDAPK